MFSQAAIPNFEMIVIGNANHVNQNVSLGDGVYCNSGYVLGIDYVRGKVAWSKCVNGYPYGPTVCTNDICFQGTQASNSTNFYAFEVLNGNEVYSDSQVGSQWSPGTPFNDCIVRGVGYAPPLGIEANNIIVQCLN